MSSRFKIGKVYPAAYKAMDALDQVNKISSVDPWHKEMIKIRASQINGCAYCVHYHTIDALKLGVDARKITLLPVWHEATNIFNEEEQLLLAMTEEITHISKHGLSDALYDKAIALFGEEKTAHAIMVMVSINAWNRLGVGLKLEPTF